MMGFNEIKGDEKKVEYLELIYDLIFVFVIGRNNTLIHYINNGFIRGEVYITYIICTLVIIQIWNYTTFFVNRYGSNGRIEHIGMFVNMYLLYYLADGTRVHWEFYVTRYCVSLGLILVNIAVMYFVKLKKRSNRTQWELKQIKWNIGILLIQALLAFLAIPVYRVTKVTLVPFAIAFGLIALFVSSKVNRQVEIDFNHLTERAMLFVVFSFGEMIITIKTYFDDGFSFSSLYYSVMIFLILVGLLHSYGELYDHLLDRNKKTTGMGFMFIHIFLIFGLNNISTALAFMHDPQVSIRPKTLYLISSYLLYYLCMFILDRYAKERLKPDGKLILIFIIAVAAFVILMILTMNNMYLNIAISVLFVYLVLLMIDRFWKSKEATL